MLWNIIAIVLALLACLCGLYSIVNVNKERKQKIDRNQFAIIWITFGFILSAVIIVIFDRIK